MQRLDARLREAEEEDRLIRTGKVTPFAARGTGAEMQFRRVQNRTRPAAQRRKPRTSTPVTSRKRKTPSSRSSRERTDEEGTRRKSRRTAKSKEAEDEPPALEPPPAASSSVSSSKDGKWSCPLCTFINSDPSKLSCEMCSTTRPRSSRPSAAELVQGLQSDGDDEDDDDEDQDLNSGLRMGPQDVQDNSTSRRRKKLLRPVKRRRRSPEMDSDEDEDAAMVMDDQDRGSDGELSSSSDEDLRSLRRSGLSDDADDEAYRQRVRAAARREALEEEAEDDEDPPLDVEFDQGFTVPGRVWDELFSYQKTAVKWLWELHLQKAGGIVADEMGLGKTVTMAGFIAGLHYSSQVLKKPGITFRLFHLMSPFSLFMSCVLIL